MSCCAHKQTVNGENSKCTRPRVVQTIIAIGQSHLTERPHRHRTWTVQSYSPDSVNVHPHLTHASLNPHESISQTASRSVQSFLHSSLQKVPILFPLKIAASYGGSGPHLIHGSPGPPESSTQTAARSVQPFLQSSLV